MAEHPLIVRVIPECLPEDLKHAALLQESEKEVGVAEHLMDCISRRAGRHGRPGSASDPRIIL